MPVGTLLAFLACLALIVAGAALCSPAAGLIVGGAAGLAVVYVRAYLAGPTKPDGP